MNKIVLVGRLVKDPEIKSVGKDGKTVARFMLAVERSFKNAQGEREVDFIPVEFWNKKAEVISEYMTKGRQISLSGRLQTRSYENKDGERKYVAEVIADEFQFIDSKKFREA